MGKGASVTPETWKKIRNAYLKGNETYASLAMRFGVGKSTIEIKASSEGWKALKDASCLTVPEKKVVRARSRVVDEAEILQDAIIVLSGAMHSAEVKSTEGCASALAKLIELHTRIVPKNASDLADIAIALGISPDDFIRQLDEKWRAKGA